MPAWSLDRARHTYSIPYWSEGYFDVDAAGRMAVLPRGPGGPALALPQIVNQATADGLKLPLLLRFSDILGDRLGKLQAAFGRAMAELDYTGGYTAVYPIKVNEHRGVARTAPLIYLMPVVAGLSAWAFTGERFTLHKVLAAAVVLAGVAVAQFGHRPPKVADASGD
jgi:arginine decarboxylase-like protein